MGDGSHTPIHCHQQSSQSPQTPPRATIATPPLAISPQQASSSSRPERRSPRLCLVKLETSNPHRVTQTPNETEQ